MASAFSDLMEFSLASQMKSQSIDTLGIVITVAYHGVIQSSIY